MPKQKTHSGAKKRFKLTGSGKVMKQGAGMPAVFPQAYLVGVERHPAFGPLNVRRCQGLDRDPAQLFKPPLAGGCGGAGLPGRDLLGRRHQTPRFQRGRQLCGALVLRLLARIGDLCSGGERRASGQAEAQ